MQITSKWLEFVFLLENLSQKKQTILHKTWCEILIVSHETFLDLCFTGNIKIYKIYV